MRPPDGLLGAHVSGRPEHAAGVVLEELVVHLRQAEVGDVRPAFFVEQDVRRFDVAMDNAVLMPWCNASAEPATQRTTSSSE